MIYHLIWNDIECLFKGSPCVGTLGYCDIFSKCRAVDAEGPLARLKNILLNPETLLTIRDWITVSYIWKFFKKFNMIFWTNFSLKTYWWAALLIGIGLIIFMAVFIKVCSVHTPSSNPRKPPALKISETLRRPIKKVSLIHPRKNKTFPKIFSSKTFEIFFCRLPGQISSFKLTRFVFFYLTFFKKYVSIKIINLIILT